MWSKIQDFYYSITGRPLSFRLYHRLKHYASLRSTSLCILHEAETDKPCPQSLYFCGTESKISAINFDAVKDHYCKQNKTSSLSSVDAVMYKNDLFLFVEIKSWRSFERYQMKPTESEADRKKEIENQAKKFKLKKKVEESMIICCGVSKDKQLFNKMHVLYVLLTDIDTVIDPMDRFRARLGYLSYKSVNLLHFNDASMVELKTVGMDTRYVCCKQFDTFYAGL